MPAGIGETSWTIRSSISATGTLTRLPSATTSSSRSAVSPASNPVTLRPSAVTTVVARNSGATTLPGSSTDSAK